MSDLVERICQANDSCLLATYRGWRAQLRGGVSPKLRERLERNIPVLVAEARARGLKLSSKGALYPAGGSNTVIHIGGNGDIDVKTHVPRSPRPRKPRRDPKPSPADGGKLLAQLEASVAAEVAKEQTP